MDTTFLEFSPSKLGCGAYLKEPEFQEIPEPLEEISEVPQVTEPEDAQPLPSKIWESVKRNKVVTSAGVIAVASLAASPLGDTIETVKDVAPYVGTGLLIGEAGWIGGAAMMLASGGKKILNPLKIKSAFKDIVDNAEDSKLFKAGFAINLTSAIGQFAVPTIAVTANMPPQTWGVLALGALDLWATIVLRRAMWKGVHKNEQNP